MNRRKNKKGRKEKKTSSMSAAVRQHFPEVICAQCCLFVGQCVCMCGNPLSMVFIVITTSAYHVPRVAHITLKKREREKGVHVLGGR